MGTEAEKGREMKVNLRSAQFGSVLNGLPVIFHKKRAGRKGGRRNKRKGRRREKPLWHLWYCLFNVFVSV